MVRNMLALTFTLMLVTFGHAQMPVIPLPNPLPVMGYAGATFTDPNYGTTITQCTDQNTDTTNTKHYSFEVCDSGGNNDKCWSPDGTMLRGMRADSGTSVVFKWNGTSCTMIPGSQLPTGASFSQVPNIHKQYYLQGTQIWQQNLDVTPPTTSMLTDLASCLPSGFVAKWHSPVTPMDQDEGFAAAFSDQEAQDTGEYALLWTAKGCHVWNTLASTLDGQPLTGVPSFRIHDEFIYGGGWITVSVGPNTCPNCPAQHGPFLWLANTNVINLIPRAIGHETNGHRTMVYLTDSPKSAVMLDPYVSTFWYIMGNTGIHFPNPQDTHCGWQANDPLDLNPFWCSQMSIPANGGTTPVPISVALQDEIYTADPITGNITRQNHCFSSGVLNQFNFRSQFCIGAEDPTGHYIAFSSDWMGNLGNTVNLNTAPLLAKLKSVFTGRSPVTIQPCTLGAPKPNECQSQIFIVTVKQ